MIIDKSINKKQLTFGNLKVGDVFSVSGSNILIKMHYIGGTCRWFNLEKMEVVLYSEEYDNTPVTFYPNAILRLGDPQ